MLYHAQNRFSVPQETVEVARNSFPKGNVYLTIRDELGAMYADTEFTSLFSHRGQRGISPGDLAFILVIQFAEDQWKRVTAKNGKRRGQATRST